jgi:hypothetical protein
MIWWIVGISLVVWGFFTLYIMFKIRDGDLAEFVDNYILLAKVWFHLMLFSVSMLFFSIVHWIFFK